MTEEKTEEEIIRNCGYIDCVRIDHPKRKWFPSDKAILIEDVFNLMYNRRGLDNECPDLIDANKLWKDIQKLKS